MDRSEKTWISDRFMPCLIERLNDQTPQVQREHYERGISLQTLRQSILENLSHILNARSRRSSAELRNDPDLIYSVLGFGLADFCGTSYSMQKQEELRREVVDQIRFFEPRLAADSVQVDLIRPDVTPKSVLEMEIRGQICAAKLNAEIVFRSRFELESGAASVKIENNR